ncbi:stage IV sporulation protein A [Desulfuribacillus stibiiarsenatis]|uniref:Stage IV sporulation protein A n=1 Tax=Desulfuribacillus stibiiarsenatis TaxID=1390249 RepID=A0A1E5L6X2_9FIRM|nr:stage IV sporulation protein A [Desulfuribacillus stibiiarsenatis]OEH85895.1 stage IV sporulation protein A [Desulfuribacillus stibiiarsenatis]
MEKIDIFKDIAERTGGDVYLGVVGPVRTGKSTFIKKFMELLVLPKIDNPSQRQRAQDELPQSSAGKTIMTTEPKFIPNNAITIEVEENLNINVRVVDCVGYAVEGAKGYEDDEGNPRMTNTPWYDDPIPFHEAAEIGTRKVIAEHATLGVVITTDGTIADIARENYIDAEERVVQELKEVGKPFVMIVNSIKPLSEETQALASELKEKYDIPVLAMSCAMMDSQDVYKTLKEVLFEFPVTEVNVNLPSWVMVLDNDHWLRSKFENCVSNSLNDIKRIRDVDRVVCALSEEEFVEKANLSNLQMGQGSVDIDLFAPDELYDQVLTEIVGVEIQGKDHLMKLMKDLTFAKKEYDQIAGALAMVKSTGYGVASPRIEDMQLQEPELIRQGSRFGVRLKATAPSIHMIKINVESEFAPIIGSEKQSEELVRYLMQDFEENPLKIWQSDIFGRSLADVVKEGISAKLSLMPENARYKFKDTLERIINEGSGGLIAIIL